MSIHVRNLHPSILGVLASEHNKLRQTVAVAASKYHADATTTAPTTGDYSAPVAGAAALCATANGSTTPTDCALANALGALLVAHFADALAHKVADTTNSAALIAAVAIPAVDAGTFVTLATAIQTAWNAHDGSTVFHYTADTNDDATSISNQSTARTSINAVKAAYNLHVVSAPAGSSFVLDAP